MEKKRKINFYGAEFKRTVLDRLASGEKMKDLSKELGLSYSTISTWKCAAIKAGTWPGLDKTVAKPGKVNNIPPAFHHSEFLGHETKIKEDSPPLPAEKIPDGVGANDGAMDWKGSLQLESFEKKGRVPDQERVNTKPAPAVNLRELVGYQLIDVMEDAGDVVMVYHREGGPDKLVRIVIVGKHIADMVRVLA